MWSRTTVPTLSSDNKGRRSIFHGDVISLLYFEAVTINTAGRNVSLVSHTPPSFGERY